MTSAAKKRILVIDNEPASTRMVRLTLERHSGFEVHELDDPTHALTALNGGDVARRLRTVPGLKAVPVVFMTSLVSEDEAARPMYSNGARVLAKPVTMAKLIDCVAGLLGSLCARPLAS